MKQHLRQPERMTIKQHMNSNNEFSITFTIVEIAAEYNSATEAEGNEASFSKSCELNQPKYELRKH